MRVMSLCLVDRPLPNINRTETLLQKIPLIKDHLQAFISRIHCINIKKVEKDNKTCEIDRYPPYVMQSFHYGQFDRNRFSSVTSRK